MHMHEDTVQTWLYQPVTFQTSREFDCEGFTPSECRFYRLPWHNWYVADLVFALPTIGLFMVFIALFVLGYAFVEVRSWTSHPSDSNSVSKRLVAATRYLSYRGFRVETLQWNSASIGVLLLGAIGTIYFFCMDLIPSPYYWPGPSMLWGNSPPLGTRSGWLALACLPFVFATATKANWITLVTGVSYEKLQVFHRWIAYAFFVLALMHTFPFIVWHIRNHDMVYQFTVSNYFTYWTGVVALLFQLVLTLCSWAPIRNLGYETFKAVHFLSTIMFVVIFFWHCGGALTSWDYFVATAAVYVPCWAYPWLRTIFEYGVGQKAQMYVEENGFIKITILANFKWHPGQHVFLRFLGFGVLHALSSCPFTICSLPSESPGKQSQITLYVRPHRGLTAKLHEYASANPGVPVSVLVDGPYSGINNRNYFESERVVLIAGGSGMGWALPFLEQFMRFTAQTKSRSMSDSELEKSNNDLDGASEMSHSGGPRSLRIITATRDVASRNWFQKALHELRSSHASSDFADIDVAIHLTGEAERDVQAHIVEVRNLDKDTSSSETPSTPTEDINTLSDAMSREETRGRPDLTSIIREEALAAANAKQRIAVFACGPTGMMHDVRNAVARENLRILGSNNKLGGMYLYLEHFAWA